MSSFKSKILAGAATLALVSGLGAAGAHAATPSAGPNAVDVFSRAFGTHSTPNYVLDVLRQGAKVGQPIILFRTSNTDPAEDFQPSFQATVSDFYAAGLVSSAVALHYGCTSGAPNSPFPNCLGSRDDYAFEVEYAPYGVFSGLCIGVAATASQGEGVSLQPCGVSGRTIWIIDTADATGISNSYTPAINGSTTNFSHPYVLTYPSSGFPTDKPRPQVQTDQLTGFSGGFGPGPGSVNDFQEWGADFGVLR